MFRLWGKEIQDNRLLCDYMYEEQSDETRTHKVFNGVEAICYKLDLGKPIWLDKNIREFQRHARTRFYQDSFVEELPFDYLEIEVVEED